MGHSLVTITETYTKLDRKRVEHDFPSIKKTPKIAIMDTLSMNTVLNIAGVSREELN